MGCRALVSVVGIIAAWVSAVHAQGVAPPQTSSCRFDASATAQVRSVSDGPDIVLEDGRTVRLSGVDIPQAPMTAEETDPRRRTALAAQAALESVLVGRSVELRWRGSVVLDRYGRMPAFIYVAGGANPSRSVAHQMLDRGHARVIPPVGDVACARELLVQERNAREAKLGLWDEPYYAVRRADSGTEVLAGQGQFTVAEGKILSVRESAGTIYMNFGRRWSEALTVTILKRRERIFSAAGIMPNGLENRHVRVRGWVEERNGPRIEALSPEQIEVAGRN